MTGSLVAWGAVSALSCAALTALAVRYAHRRGLIDQPGPRRSHHRGTPRGGGVAIIGTIVLVALGLALGEPSTRGPVAALGLGALALAAVGFWDDHRPLPARWRLAAQFAVGALVIWSLGGVGAVTVGPWLLAGGYLDLVALVALVWLINLFNFMDGINGIASLQAAFIAAVFALFCALDGDRIGAVLGAIVLGACLGFVPWNFPRARIFMGDAGSYGLGFTLGFLFLWGHRQESFSLVTALVACGVFVVDATLTLSWRLVRRVRWYTPHRDHAYQLLVRSGWSHARVVGAVAGVNLLLVAPGLWWARGVPARELAVGVAILVLLSALWCWVRWHCRRDGPESEKRSRWSDNV